MLAATVADQPGSTISTDLGLEIPDLIRSRASGFAFGVERSQMLEEAADRRM
jgi:hypothetical protein